MKSGDAITWIEVFRGNFGRDGENFDNIVRGVPYCKPEPWRQSSGIARLDLLGGRSAYR